jgi:hypothetical protein
MCRQPTIVKTAHLAVAGRVNDTPGGGSSVSRENHYGGVLQPFYFSVLRNIHHSYLEQGLHKYVTFLLQCIYHRPSRGNPTSPAYKSFDSHCCECVGPVFEYCSGNFEYESAAFPF